MCVPSVFRGLVGGVAGAVFGGGLGGGGGGTNILQTAPLPPPLPGIPTEADPGVGAARRKARARAALAAGRSSTILTSGLGLLDEPATAGKKVLGA